MKLKKILESQIDEASTGPASKSYKNSFIRRSGKAYNDRQKFMITSVRTLEMLHAEELKLIEVELQIPGNNVDRSMSKRAIDNKYHTLIEIIKKFK